MFLQRFKIKHFRAINDLVLEFNKGLNVLIGENNAGKTCIIDALRICLSHGSQRREIYVSPGDFFINRSEISEVDKDVEFDLYFKIEKAEEVGWFHEMLNTYPDGTQDIQLHLKYYIDERNGTKKVKYKLWGGSNEGQLVPPEVLSLLYHVHLDALRDAEECLRPIRGNRLGQLFANIQTDPDETLDKEKKKAIANKVKAAVENDPEFVRHIKDGKDKINEHLEETNFANKHQPLEVNFLPYDFNKLVDNLKLQIPIYSESILNGDNSKQKHFEIYQNGLGYNNLIYTATVLGDLKQRKALDQEAFIALLIEEPEAHLHPQLQNLFFNYLAKLDVELGFQIFVTSHSPTITAKSNLKSITVIQSHNDVISSLSIERSGLSEDNKKYLGKFLDVTKAQIFFSNGAILVEGISEALLLPVFGKLMNDAGKYNIEKAGIELVNINGIAFEHFANLFNHEEEGKRSKSRCAIITDDDRSAESDEISSRAKLAKALEKQNLKVVLAEVTFEFELFIAGNNKKLMLEIFSKMHPIAASRIESSPDIRVYAANFLEKVNSNKAKSELAHRLSLRLIEDSLAASNFSVPNYIQEAIKYVMSADE